MPTGARQFAALIAQIERGGARHSRRSMRQCRRCCGGSRSAALIGSRRSGLPGDLRLCKIGDGVRLMLV
jgi:hypothetical protein